MAHAIERVQAWPIVTVVERIRALREAHARNRLLVRLNLQDRSRPPFAETMWIHDKTIRPFRFGWVLCGS